MSKTNKAVQLLRYHCFTEYGAMHEVWLDVDLKLEQLLTLFTSKQYLLVISGVGLCFQHRGIGNNRRWEYDGL